jgi:hypothetical protein
MKIVLTKIALILIPAISLSMTVAAHDPKFHAKKAEKADCSKMDHSKMDMQDPVALAMINKCMKQQVKQLKNKMDHSKMEKGKVKKDDNKEHDH